MEKYFRFLYIIFLLVMICAIYPVSAQYEIKSSTFSNGGEILTSTDFGSASTLGQPFIGTSSNVNFNNYSGYWYSVNIFVGMPWEDDQFPKRFELYQNFPNPFNPVTRIKYAVPRPTHVRIEIYNVLGQRVRTLVNEEKQPGYYTVDFNASSLASGFYIYRMQTSGFRSVKKMIITK
jgi:hypothetical protein